ncbi:MAG: NUDIX hydrolase [Gammaproteobacteria bacterium]|nr:NUDIX hydrolase [Gammaproteobacteria bacterium]
MDSPAYPDTPRVAVGAVVIRDGAVLLVRRAKPPSQGLWAIPGGSVELGESLQQAAERELLEETGVRVRAGAPCFAFDAVHHDADGRVRYHYVVIDVRAEYVSGEPAPRDDALDVRWVRPDELAALEVSERTLELLRSAPDFGEF